MYRHSACWHDNRYAVHHPYLLSCLEQTWESKLFPSPTFWAPTAAAEGQEASELAQGLKGNGYVIKNRHQQRLGPCTPTPATLQPCLGSIQQKLGKRLPPICRAGSCPCWTVGVAEEACLGPVLYQHWSAILCVPGQALQECPLTQQPAAAPVRLGLQGTELVTRHWILHALFHPTFPSSAVMSHFTVEETS